jgi:two-component system response regulator
MPALGKIPILIVEDDATIRFLLQTAAQRCGLFDPVATAVDGQAALEMLHAKAPENLPAVVLTDLSMPRMTGHELLRAIKADPALRALPVAVITSSDLPEDRELALAEGACSYATKPYGIDALMKVFVALRETCREIAASATHA